MDVEERKCRKGYAGRHRKAWCYLAKCGIYPSKCGSQDELVSYG